MRLVIVVVLLLALARDIHSSEEALAELKKRLTEIFSRIEKLDRSAEPNSVNLGSLWEHFASSQPPAEKAECKQCAVIVSAVLDAFRSGVPPEMIRDTIVLTCKEFHVYTDRVCEKRIHIHYAPVVYMLENTENVTADRVCAIIRQGSDCGKDDPALDWSVDLGDEIPPEQHSAPSQNQSAAGPLRILHLTDLHYDPHYMVGGNAQCDEGHCCRSDQGQPASPTAAAGRWGDYRFCDVPWEAITDTLDHVRAQHQKIDYVYMTGDLIDHATWDTSAEANNATIIKVFKELKRAFGDIPVYPVAGNHEMHPSNLYPPVSVTRRDISTAWLYETLADQWSTWLPEHARDTVLRGGFYTVVVRPGLRVVALNNNHCFTANLWLVHGNRDPDGQLQWLVEVLREAETAGEKVHLLYHVPTGGSDCYKRWSREFTRIVNRFHRIITGQFSGHTHNDEFRVFYSSKEPSRPINVVHIGGSLTPFAYVNSNYRIYSVDPNTSEILDFETWIYNLTASNLGPSDHLPWEKMYSFREAYGGHSPTPEVIATIARRMAEDDDLVQQYFRYFNLNGDPLLEMGCDAHCKELMVCSIVIADSNDLSHCDELLTAIRAKQLT